MKVLSPKPSTRVRIAGIALALPPGIVETVSVSCEPCRKLATWCSIRLDDGSALTVRPEQLIPLAPRRVGVKP